MKSEQGAVGWVPIERSTFWDVPRIFVVRLATMTALFDCPFDDELDDYSPVYTAYRLPPTVVPPWPKWDEIARQRVEIGTVRVADVRFDATRRHFVWSADLLGALAGYEEEIEAVVREQAPAAPPAPPAAPPPPPSPYR